MTHPSASSFIMAPALFMSAPHLSQTPPRSSFRIHFSLEGDHGAIGLLQILLHGGEADAQFLRDQPLSDPLQAEAAEHQFHPWPQGLQHGARLLQPDRKSVV